MITDTLERLAVMDRLDILNYKDQMLLPQALAITR